MLVLHHRVRRHAEPSHATFQSPHGPGCICTPGRLLFADPFFADHSFAGSLFTDLRRNRMKITVTAHKPRNPIVAHAQFRRAGSHRPGGGASRQQASRLLQRELERLKHSP
ncbi:MAG: hypothetical protein ABL916_22480 [Burkholderiaceae bacterium]